jgi:D-alanine-D-alanine ligase
LRRTFEEVNLMLENMTIVVLKGGPGSEREVSLRSASGVAAALREAGAGAVSELDVRGADFEIPQGTDICFNVIHGTFGEDGQIQEILERRGIRYTGARSASSRLAFDKIASKERFLEGGVPTPGGETLDLAEGQRPGFELPLVIKPPCEGSSVGVFIVRDGDELERALEESLRFGARSMVEEYIEGKELTVGILGGEALPVVHISPRDGFYDINNKYPWMNQAGGTDYFCPADLSEEVTDRVKRAALAAHRALGVEVYSRVDVLLRERDEAPFVLEVNTLPGMTESSLLPKAALAAGIGYGELCRRIIELSWDLS